MCVCVCLCVCVCVFVCILGGVRDEFVAIVDTVTRVQILSMTVSISHRRNTLAKDMNPIIFLLFVDK